VPSKVCHNKLVSEGKCVQKKVYVAGKGYEIRWVCPALEMARCLSVEMARVHGGAGASLITPVAPYTETKKPEKKE